MSSADVVGLTRRLPMTHKASATVTSSAITTSLRLMPPSRSSSARAHRGTSALAVKVGG